LDEIVFRQFLLEKSMDFIQKDSAQGSPAEGSAGAEHRVNPRSHCWGTAWINILPDGIKVMSYLIDLGLGGCLIETDSAIPAMIDTSVEVLLNVADFKLRLAGVIRHMDGETKAGIEFTDLSLRKVEQIHALMAALIQAEKERLAGVKELGG
jgi:hypothetical protein